MRTSLMIKVRKNKSMRKRKRKRKRKRARDKNKKPIKIMIKVKRSRSTRKRRKDKSHPNPEKNNSIAPKIEVIDFVGKYLFYMKNSSKQQKYHPIHLIASPWSIKMTKGTHGIDLSFNLSDR